MVDRLKQNARDAAGGLFSESWRRATLGPFRQRTFLAIWAASLVSNFGSLIQVVGASWLMTTLAPTPDMVALVQAATTAPIMLLSLAAGATADIWDRRSLMLIALGFMMAVGLILTVLGFQGALTPWSLLALTFLLGIGTAVYGPAWQSSVGEQVPRDQLSAAVSLNSLSFNLARTAGPAVGGVLVAALGPTAAFLANALSYVGLIAVLTAWRRPKFAQPLPPENMWSAMGAGLRYARLSPGIRSVLVRGCAFGLMGSAIWALLPLIARDLLKGGAVSYGVLYGAFGGGAVGGALISASARLRYANERIVSLATLGFGIATVVAALSTAIVLSMGALVIAGASWVAALSTLNVTVQTSSPRWVVGRTVAIYQMLTFGGLAVGSWLWGIVANAAGLVAGLAIAGVLMSLSAALGKFAPLLQPEGLNLDPSHAFPADQQALKSTLADTGPVVVTVEYRIPLEDALEFRIAMRELRRIRRRDGARRWTLMQDAADPELWVERYHSPNWVEHLRRHHRFTVADQEIEQRVLAFHRGPEAPSTRHLIERPPAEGEVAMRSSVPTDPNLPSASTP